jgi:hypothetical protein
MGTTHVFNKPSILSGEITDANGSYFTLGDQLLHRCPCGRNGNVDDIHLAGLYIDGLDGGCRVAKCYGPVHLGNVVSNDESAETCRAKHAKLPKQ